MSKTEILEKMKALKEYQRMSEEVASIIDGLKDEIKTFMGDDEILIAGEYKATYKTVESSRLDTAAIRKELPEVAKKYTIATKTRRFTLT